MEENKDHITIIFVHHATSVARSQLSKECFEALYETTRGYPVELIVIDNGEYGVDSMFLLNRAIRKEITHYIKNADNLWFGTARNQGLILGTGKYVCIIDNDVKVYPGWLEECINILDKTKEGEYFVTPLAVDRLHSQTNKYYRHPVTLGKKEYQVNVFAGSSCWVGWRKDFDSIGMFRAHQTAGSDWCRRYNKLGFEVILLPEPKAENLGKRYTPYEGYNKKEGYGVIKKHLINGNYLQINKKNARGGY